MSQSMHQWLDIYCFSFFLSGPHFCTATACSSCIHLHIYEYSISSPMTKEHSDWSASSSSWTRQRSRTMTPTTSDDCTQHSRRMCQTLNVKNEKMNLYSTISRKAHRPLTTQLLASGVSTIKRIKRTRSGDLVTLTNPITLTWPRKL